MNCYIKIYLLNPCYPKIKNVRDCGTVYCEIRLFITYKSYVSSKYLILALESKKRLFKISQRNNCKFLLSWTQQIYTVKINLENIINLALKLTSLSRVHCWYLSSAIKVSKIVINFFKKHSNTFKLFVSALIMHIDRNLLWRLPVIKNQ